MMSDRKRLILSEIQKKYETKYAKNNEDLKNFIAHEL